MLVFEPPTCLVSILGFSCGVALPMGKAAKPFIFEGSKRGNVVLRGRHMALRDIPTCVIACRKSFCVPGRETFAYFCKVFPKMIFIFRGKRSLLRAFANRIVGAASSGDNAQVAQQAWGIVRVSLCVAGAAFGKDPLSGMSFCAAGAVLGHVATCHSRLDPLTLSTMTCKLNFSHSAPHFTLHTIHCTLDIPHPQSTTYILHSPHFTLHTLHFTLHISHSKTARYTPDFHFTLTLYTLYFTLHTLIYTVHCTLHTLHYTFRLFTLHCTLRTLRFALYNPHYTLYTL